MGTLPVSKLNRFDERTWQAAQLARRARPVTLPACERCGVAGVELAHRPPAECARLGPRFLEELGPRMCARCIDLDIERRRESARQNGETR